MEADISIWRKTGHFYFALTRTQANASGSLRLVQKTFCGVLEPSRGNAIDSPNPTPISVAIRFQPTPLARSVAIPASTVTFCDWTAGPQ
jgi:hypothetical protein